MLAEKGCAVFIFAVLLFELRRLLPQLLILFIVKVVSRRFCGVKCVLVVRFARIIAMLQAKFGDDDLRTRVAVLKSEGVHIVLKIASRSVSIECVVFVKRRSRLILRRPRNVKLLGYRASAR